MAPALPFQRRGLSFPGLSRHSPVMENGYMENGVQEFVAFIHPWFRSGGGQVLAYGMFQAKLFGNGFDLVRCGRREVDPNGIINSVPSYHFAFT